MQANKIISFIRAELGDAQLIREMTQADLKNLPLYLRKSFRFNLIRIMEKELVLVEYLTDEHVTPSVAFNTAIILGDLLMQNIVFAFSQLTPYQRNKLTEYRLPFIIPGKLIYLPILGISFKDITTEKQEVRITMRPTTQLLLLHHLLIENLEGLKFGEISTKLNISAMSISRASADFLMTGLADVVGKRDKNLQFNLKGRKLFEKARDYMINPVQQTVYVENKSLDQYKMIFTASEEALANRTDLSHGKQKERAISEFHFRDIYHELINVNSYEGNYKLEVWSYYPGKLTKSRDVDPLSLYLSLQNNIDDRIQMALEQLLNQIIW